MQAFASYILRGRLHAILVATVAAVLALIVPLLSHISGAAVALVVLRKGVLEGVLVAAGAAGVLSGLGLLSSLQGTTVTTFLIAMIAVVWLPVIVVATVHAGSRAYGKSLAAAGALGLAALLLVYGLVGDVEGWWESLLQSLLAPMLEELRTTLSDAELQTLIRGMAAVMSGLLAATMVYTVMINLFIARWWQSLLFNPGGFRDEFHALRLGRQATVIALIVIALNTFGGERLGGLAENLMVLTVAVFSLHGLALLHAVVARLGANSGWLIGVYVLIFLLPPQMMVLLSAAGLTDSWVDFRGRLAIRDGRRRGDDDRHDDD